jgi:hypothetical protein
MFNRKLIKTLKQVINALEEEKKKLEKENSDLKFKIQQRDKLIGNNQNEIKILLENSAELRKQNEELKIKNEDKENNLEFICNNLSTKNKKLINRNSED